MMSSNGILDTEVVLVTTSGLSVPAGPFKSESMLPKRERIPLLRASFLGLALLLMVCV